MAPPKAFYVPEFITEDEEQFLLRNVYSAPKPKWRQLAHRRLQNWGGFPHPNGMVAEDLPEWLRKYVDRVTDLHVFDGKCPNHVLINEYLPGQGIMPHTDGPLFYPTITTINLGSHAVLNLYDTNDDADSPAVVTQHIGCLFLRPRSLLVLQEDLYARCHHGIDGVDNDVVQDVILNADAARVKIGEQFERGTRVSVTIRHVPKTLKIKFR